MNELGEFLERERVKRHQSKRGFASNLHTSPDTLARMIEDSEAPTIVFLRKVSSYTGASLLALLEMSFPDEIRQPSADEIRIAQLLNTIPEPRRSFIIELIENAQLRIENASNDESEIRIVKQGKRSGDGKR